MIFTYINFKKLCYEESIIIAKYGYVYNYWFSQTSNCSLETSKVPEKIMKKFEKSIIYNKDGAVRGAFIGDLKKYMTDDEITNKMTSIAIKAGAKSVKAIFFRI